MTSLPGISVLIPTLNSERYLEKCLSTIREQDYPTELIEIIAADGGSTDSTIALLTKYRADLVVPNPGITGEAARAILIRLAAHELILSVDSDNYLVGSDWLRRMVRPLTEDQTVFASEPLRWDYVQSDPPLNRYFALTGINDPISLFIGNYGRYSYLTNTWTQFPHAEEHHNGYLIAELDPTRVPTMGANGFLARKAVIRTLGDSDYYFDIDVVNELVKRGNRRIAKVDVAFGHYFARDLSALRRKTRRRIDDYLFWRGSRNYPWFSSGLWPYLRFAADTVLVVPLAWQAWTGWQRVHDRAWLYHIPVCWLTMWQYATAVIRSVISSAPHSRRGWQH